MMNDFNPNDWEVVESTKPNINPNEWEVVGEKPMGMGEAAARAAYSKAMRVARGITAPIMESGLFGEALAEQSRLEGQRRQADYQRARQAHPTTALIAGTLGQVPGEVANLVALGRLAKPLTVMAPGVARFLQGENLLNRTAQGALAGGALGFLNEPGQGENRAENAGFGVLGGMAAQPIVSGATALARGVSNVAQKGLEKFFPASLKSRPSSPQLKGRFSPEAKYANLGEPLSPEMLQRANIAGETPTPLGEIIKSPDLKKTFENTLATEKQLNPAAQAVLDKGKAFIKGVPKNPDDYLKNLLNQSYKAEKSVSKELFKPVNDLAEKANLKLNLNQTTKATKRALKNLDDSGVTKANPALWGKLKRLTGLAQPSKTIPGSKVDSKILDQFGKPIATKITPPKTITPSLTETKLLKSELYNEGERLIKSQSPSDRYAGALYKRLSNFLEQDIKKSIAKTQNSQLKAAYEAANKNYREKFSPFLTKEVFPLFSGKKGSDAIVENVIKPGRLDKVDTLRQIQKALPKSRQDEIGKAYLSKYAFNKEGQFDPREMSKALNKLGTRQAEAIFGKDQAKRLRDWQKLYNMNSEAINRMFNPKTGARVLDKDLPGYMKAFYFLSNPKAAALSFAGKKVMESKRGDLADMLISPEFRRQVLDQKLAMALKAAGKNKTMPVIPFSGFNLGSSQAPYEESY